MTRDREDADRRAEESDRRQQLHDLERWAAHQPEEPGPDRPDPIHVVRAHLHDDPDDTDAYLLARWSLAARMIRDAAGSGDTLTDLGPEAMRIATAAQRGEWAIGDLARVGIAKGGRWIEWNPPGFRVEPVPPREGTDRP